jgi:hypothetical protein
MSDVRPKETVEEEGFVVPAPCETGALLGSIARGAIAEGVNDIQGGPETEVVIMERAPEGIAVLDGVIDVGRGVKEVFIFVSW